MTTLSTIRFECEETLEDTLTDAKVISWCNNAQADFMLRVFIPGSTTQAIDTTSLTYTLSPTTIREIRRLRLQTDVTDLINRSYHPVYTFYNGVFEVPAPFGAADTLLIDYYAYLTTFTAITEEIQLNDRFKPLYTLFIESQYYDLKSTRKEIGELAALRMNEKKYNAYLGMKKQVASFYNIEIGTQKPNESGW